MTSMLVFLRCSVQTSARMLAVLTDVFHSFLLPHTLPSKSLQFIYIWNSVMDTVSITVGLNLWIYYPNIRRYVVLISKAPLDRIQTNEYACVTHWRWQLPGGQVRRGITACMEWTDVSRVKAWNYRPLKVQYKSERALPQVDRVLRMSVG
jgi:hypothetical protein